MNTTADILITSPSKDYELLDSGEGEKLERFGPHLLSRPDPQALWEKRLSPSEWAKAVAVFKSNAAKGSWAKKMGETKPWTISLAGLRFYLKLSSFKHVGIFPEQSPNWEWIKENLKQKAQSKKLIQKPVRVLNLFGYTGGATLAAAEAGAEVCHVDGSKVAIDMARENADLSNLSGKPIRWILDDAAAFVRRETKRGKKYDGIIMDPPAFGHGPGGELWKIEENFLPFIQNCKKLLSDNPLFFLINGYASGYSSLAYANILGNLMKDYQGGTESGELAIKESGSSRLLPTGIFARWRAA